MVDEPANTSEIKVRLVRETVEMYAIGLVDALHAERIIARLVGQYSDWLVNPGPDPQPEEAEASEPTEEQTTASHTFERECDWCGQTYRASRKDSRYCSKVCGNRAYRALRKQRENPDA